MNSKVNSIKYFFVIGVVVMLGSCDQKSDREKKVRDSLALKSKLTEDKLSGTFEYSEAVDKGFLLIQIETTTRGDSLAGKFFGGVYSKKSETGEYTEPSVSAEGVLKGLIRKKKVAEMQMKVTKVDRATKEAPDFLGMVNLSTQISTAWIFRLDNGTLVSQNGTMTPDGKGVAEYVWKKIK